MELRTDEEGILYLLWDGQGHTFNQMLGFLKLNKVKGFEETDKDSEIRLRELLSSMIKKEWIEKRSFLDGTTDYDIENDGSRILKINNRYRDLIKKWRLLD